MQNSDLAANLFASFPSAPWVYLGESFPLRVRPKAIALGSATNWLWNFLLGFFAPRIAGEYVLAEVLPDRP